MKLIRYCSACCRGVEEKKIYAWLILLKYSSCYRHTTVVWCTIDNLHSLKNDREKRTPKKDTMLIITWTLNTVEFMDCVVEKLMMFMQLRLMCHSFYYWLSFESFPIKWLGPLLVNKIRSNSQFGIYDNPEVLVSGWRRKFDITNNNYVYSERNHSSQVKLIQNEA